MINQYMEVSTKTLARAAANGLPIYRVVRGFQTADRLRTDMRDPTNRTWSFGVRVLLDASTDFIDGPLARYAGTTRIGGYLDQLADKAWFLQIESQLRRNDEISATDYWLPAVRDMGTLIIRPVAQHYGLQTDARISGKIKMNAQVLAAVSSCTPLAHDYPELVRGLHHFAAGASAFSGIEMLVDYQDELADRYKTEPLAQFLVATTASVVSAT